MIQINLLPVREARRKADLRQQGMQLLLALLVVGAGIGFVHSWMQDRIQVAQNRIEQMKSDIEKFKPQIKKVEAFREKKASLEKKIDIIEGLDAARSGPVRMLDELASHTPERLWLESLKTNGSSITLEGSSLDNELVASFLGVLNDSPYFEKVDLNSTATGSGSNDKLRIVEFSIQAKMATPQEDES